MLSTTLRLAAQQGRRGTTQRKPLALLVAGDAVIFYTCVYIYIHICAFVCLFVYVYYCKYDVYIYTHIGVLASFKATHPKART